MRRVTKAATGESVICYPTVQCEVIPEAGFDGEDPFNSAAMTTEDALLEACASDEEEVAGYDYIWQESPESHTLTKHRRRKPVVLQEDEGFSDATPMFSVKEAVPYKEYVVFHKNAGDYKPVKNDIVQYVLADLNCVVPFGYPLEQFLTWMKNDVA